MNTTAMLAVVGIAIVSNVVYRLRWGQCWWTEK